MANAYSEQGPACSQLIVLLQNYSEFGGPLELGALGPGPHVAPLLIRHCRVHLELSCRHTTLYGFMDSRVSSVLTCAYIL